MKKKLKYLVNSILFILLIILTFKIVFRDQSITEIMDVVKKVKKPFILASIISMCIYVICEAWNISRTLKNLNEKSSFLSNIKYALIGFFFSGITPAASGGQPMQIYYMHKEKISVANSTLALLINLCSMQVVTISLALVSVAFNHKYLTGPLIGFFILGIALNMSALALLAFTIFSKNSLKKIVDFFIMIVKKLRFKHADQIQQKIEEEINKYQVGSKYIKKHKKLILKTLATSYIEYIALYSVSYWVYRSFGFKDYNIVQLVSIQSMLYGAVSGIPSPGAVGVTEGGFIEIFKTIYPENLLRSAMILNRGINFYLLMVVSGLVTIANATKVKNVENKDKEYMLKKKKKKNRISDIEKN